MASTACFVIVSKNDIPIYEAEVGSALKVCFFQYTPSRINVVSAEILFYDICGDNSFYTTIC